MERKKLGRRKFLNTGLITVGSLCAGTSRASIQASPVEWNETVDVVVLGCGGAGLMAACQAHDAKAKVAIFDAGKSPYHTATSLCGGVFTACGSRLQKNDPEGQKDSWQQFAEDIMAYGNYMSLKEPVYCFAKNSGLAYDWLEANGLAKHYLEPYLGHSRLRAHRQASFSGRDYVDVLVKQITLRDLKIRHGMPLNKFIFDPETNTVLGVRCGKNGNFVNVRATKGVVMATGGFTGTVESLERWVPNVAGKGVAIGGACNDGTALMIAVRDLGVPLSHMQYIASYPCGVVTNGRNGPYCRYWFVTNNGGLLLNKNGQRFVSEKEGICHITPLLAFQPDGCHYVFTDSAGWERTMKKIQVGALIGIPAWPASRVEKEFKLQKNLWKCDTLEELCEKSGMNLQNLREQIKTWNQAIESGNDTQFGRTDQKWKIGEGPYYMVRMATWNNLSCGGVRVNEELQVLGWDMKPIQHLYAAGETIAGVHGAYYCGGNACGFAHTSGFVAGRNVVKA